jgi:ABC-type multidrug transport system fused ATPase/permease subunit
LEVENKQWAEPTWKLLLRVLLPSERRALIGIFALILVGTILETFSIGIIIPVLSVLSSDEATNSIPFIGSNETISKNQLIQIAVGLMLAIYILKNVFLAFSIWIQRGFLTRVTSRIGSRMFEVYLHQPYSFHLQKNSSTLIRNTQDASMLIASGIEPMLTILTEGLIVSALLLVLLIVEPVGTLCVVGVLLTATFVFQKFFDHKLQRWGTMRQIEKGSIIQTVQQGLGAAKDLQVLGREDWFINEHHKRQKLDAKLLRRINTVQALPRLWLEVMAMTGLVGLVGIMLFTDKNADSIVPVVGLFAATAFRVLPSINKIVNGKQTLKVSRSTIETVFQDLRLFVSSQSGLDKLKLDFDSIKIKELNFHYENVEVDVLKSVNIAINRGEAVGFVGQSGSGKSTLIDIMLGLLSPQSGSVLINGQDISQVKSA